MRFFLGVTTYNRVDFLKRTIETWDETRNRDVEWTLAIADDGSTDGTLDYLDSISFDKVRLILFKNNRVGVHKQTNQLFLSALATDFDFGFQADDDIEFLREGWDAAYYEAAIRTKFHHLVFFDIEWQRVFRGGWIHNTAKRDGLESNTHVLNSMGAFWTFTPESLDAVGGYDEYEFGKFGWGHVDWSWRACRFGFNNEDTCFDIEDSSQYLKLIQDNYRTSAGEFFNTPREEHRKIIKLGNPDRLHIAL